MTRAGRVERLAPTGEGIVRGDGKVVFVDGALPGEEIEFEIFETRTRFERARAIRVFEASPDRQATTPHSSRCGGTDWAHFAVDPARMAKRLLFLETMERIAKIAPTSFGDLPISHSGLEYRLRNQFHVERRGSGSVAGFFERRTRRLVPLDGCAIVSVGAREWIGAVEDGIAGPLRPGEVATVETVESFTGAGEGFRIAARIPGRGSRSAASPESVELEIPGLPAFHVSAGAFFQINRHRVGAFWQAVRDLAAEIGATSALEAYAGSGYLSSALLAAGCRVTSIEAAASSADDARENARRWGSGDAWRYVAASVEEHLDRDDSAADLVLADPPRAGLGRLAERLAARARRHFLYVSCEPACLARDLGTLRDGCGFRVVRAWLEDFFPLTHRVEAAVLLARRT